MTTPYRKRIRSRIEAEYGKSFDDVLKGLAKKFSYQGAMKHLGLTLETWKAYRPLFKRNKHSPQKGALIIQGKTLRELAEENGVKVEVLRYRIKAGWELDKALNYKKYNRGKSDKNKDFDPFLKPEAIVDAHKRKVLEAVKAGKFNSRIITSFTQIPLDIVVRTLEDLERKNLITITRAGRIILADAG